MAVTLESLIDKKRSALAELENRLGYQFKDLHLLQVALIHSSFSFEQGKTIGRDNETLEFLGDAVLDLAVAVALYKRFPEMNEGSLTQLRAALVQEGHLAEMAREIELGQHLLLGKGEDASEGRRKASILSGTLEAVVGAIFLDGGYEAAEAIVNRHFTPRIAENNTAMLVADPKSQLQEHIQERYPEGPEYVLEKEEGPDHAKLFTVSVRFRGRVLGVDQAGSKKEAEKRAAAQALDKLSANAIAL